MLALDDAGADDTVVTQGNYKFCINKELLEKVQNVTIDFTYMGFSVEPAVSLGGGSCGAGGCGGSCSPS